MEIFYDNEYQMISVTITYNCILLDNFADRRALVTNYEHFLDNHVQDPEIKI